MSLTTRSAAVDERLPQPSSRRGDPWALPVLALLVVAVGGRYSLSRGGFDAFAWLDLRVVGLAVAVPLVATDVRRGSAHRVVPRFHDGWLVAAALFFLYQLGSGAWSPDGARVSANLVDVACTAFLVLGLYLHARLDPARILRRALWVVWGTGLVFGLGALVGGSGAQGRYAAFGGGPNVFVRLEVLALIAAGGLLALHAPRWVLLPVPLFVLSAVLSGSRGGLVAGLMVGAGAVVMGGRRARRIGWQAALAGGGSVLVAYLMWPPARALIDSRFVEQTTEQGYDSGRSQIWGAAVELFAQHPWVGTGLDGFYGLVGRRIGVEYPHDYVLAVAAEGGAVGLILLSAAVITWAVTVATAPSLGTGGRTMVIAASYVALASLFSGDYYDARLAWCFGALAAAAAARSTALPGAKDPRVGRQRSDELR